MQQPAFRNVRLFGRINHGNAISLPLGLNNYGWLGEIHLQCTPDQLFHREFGWGYPPEEAAKKKRDTEDLQQISRIAERSLPDVLPQLDKRIVAHALQWNAVRKDIRAHGARPEIVSLIERYGQSRCAGRMIGSQGSFIQRISGIPWTITDKKEANSVKSAP